MVAKSKDSGIDPEADSINTVTEALRYYTATIPEDERPSASAELARFVRWLGNDRSLGSLAPPEIGDYSDHIGAHGTAPDAVDRLAIVKLFLAHLKKKGHIDVNLAQHLRLRRGRGATTGAKTATSASGPGARLTKSGHQQMQDQLAELIIQRTQFSEDIRKAAADKDVRENAPLEAAREAHGMVSLKIGEIEETLRGAEIITERNGAREKGVVRLGGRVTIKDLSSGRATAVQLVHPDEANPLSGKMSSESPVGGAIIGHAIGDTVTVETPAGSKQFEIVKAN
ncbi:MAG: GreA/GreB family elongation factor [Dehalococcoidia bacterium]|jgi:transcription elongation factor GreA|nr:GreA/GreB family elongation factor [Dehalococcoidia bacterium]